MIALLALSSASCSPLAPKKLIIYHVEFEADGQDYNRTVTHACYGPVDFEQGTHWVADDDEEIIHGTLRDGSRYVIETETGLTCALSGRVEIPSIIYVQVSSAVKSLVESFDDKHSHSMRHRVHIKESFLDFRDDGYVLYTSVYKRTNKPRGSMPDGVHYATVGAKLTPFSSVEDAKRDFYVNECPSRTKRIDRRVQLRLQCVYSIFNFHPIDAVISNSETDAFYDGRAFNVFFGQSGQAPTWVSDPNVVCHQMMCGFKGMDGGFALSEKDDVALNFDGQGFALSPFLGRTFYLDPKSGKVIIFFVDNVTLRFYDPQDKK